MCIKPRGNRPDNCAPAYVFFARRNLNISRFFLVSNLIRFNLTGVFFFFFTVGRRELHQLREGHQLAVVRRVRRDQIEREQLGVDAVHRTRAGQSHLHRSQVHHPGLFAVPGVRAVVQGDVFAALLRVRRGHPGTAALGTRQLQISR